MSSVTSMSVLICSGVKSSGSSTTPSLSNSVKEWKEKTFYFFSVRSFSFIFQQMNIKSSVFPSGLASSLGKIPL